MLSRVNEIHLEGDVLLCLFGTSFYRMVKTDKALVLKIERVPLVCGFCLPNTSKFLCFLSGIDNFTEIASTNLESSSLKVLTFFFRVV